MDSSGPPPPESVYWHLAKHCYFVRPNFRQGQQAGFTVDFSFHRSNQRGYRTTQRFLFRSKPQRATYFGHTHTRELLGSLFESQTPVPARTQFGKFYAIIMPTFACVYFANKIVDSLFRKTSFRHWKLNHKWLESNNRRNYSVKIVVIFKYQPFKNELQAKVKNPPSKPLPVHIRSQTLL